MLLRSYHLLMGNEAQTPKSQEKGLFNRQFCWMVSSRVPAFHIRFPCRVPGTLRERVHGYPLACRECGVHLGRNQVGNQGIIMGMFLMVGAVNWPPRAVHHLCTNKPVKETVYSDCWSTIKTGSFLVALLFLHDSFSLHCLFSDYSIVSDTV